MGNHDVQQRWFSDDGDVRSCGQQAIWGRVVVPCCGQVIDTKAGGFFIAGQRQNQIRSTDSLIVLQPEQSGQHGGHSALHIAGSAATDSSIGFCGSERRDGHAIDRYGVLVHIEQDCSCGGRAVQSREYVASSRDNLLREGVDPAHCHVTGNTVVDALLGARERSRLSPSELPAFAARLGLPAAFAARHLGPGGAPWVLVTGHRRESFGEGFERICQAILRLTEEHPDLGVIYPVHLNPQVQEPVRRLLQGHPRVALVAPTDYLDFIRLLDRSTFVLTDSGGVQEEAPSLGKPVLVLRESTERPEGVAAGTCVLVGTDPGRIAAEAARLLRDPAEYARRSALRNPYGDGTSATRIRAILEREPL